MLWGEGDVEAVEIPVGVTLSFLGSKGREGMLQLGAGDGCEEGACFGMKSVKLRQDLMRGLRQMREAGESATSCVPCRRKELTIHGLLQIQAPQ
jgi:hypothetical protein